MRSGYRAVAVVVCLISALALSGAPAAAAGVAERGVAAANSLIVDVADGRLEGERVHGVDNFLGIPYAAPPVDDVRWRAPAPVVPWQGTRAVTTYENACPALENTNGGGSFEEDCLFLNVQRPAGTRKGDKTPVLVFIHGGGGINGSGDQHDGTKFVREGRIMVVSLNYRLGILGNFGHPALTAEAGESGNYGFQDQQQALRWVKTNIAEFGGDPAKVTVAGESFGALSVCYHLTAPGSAGLFAAAIIQSFPDCVAQSQQDADAVGGRFAVDVGCGGGPDPLECLREIDAQTLVEKVGGQFETAIVAGTPTMPDHPRQSISEGAFRQVPIIIGTNRDEARTFNQPKDFHTTQDEYEEVVRANLGELAEEFLRRYPWSAYDDGSEYTGNYVVSAIDTDSFWACGTRNLARDLAASTTTWQYEFAHRDGPGLTEQYPGYIWGAGHAAELAYFWPSFDNGDSIADNFDPAERSLARKMVAYWTAFVKRGQPVVVAQPQWSPLAAQEENSTVLSLDVGRDLREISSAQFVQTHQCEFWDRLNG